MARITVRKAQMGLTEAHRSGMRIQGPGTIDGRWGPNTQASLDAFLSSPRVDFHGEVEIETIGGTETIETQPRIVQELNNLALAHVARPAGRPAGPMIPTGPAAVMPLEIPIPTAGIAIQADSGPKAATMAFAALLGLGAIGGLVWWSMKGRR